MKPYSWRMSRKFKLDSTVDFHIQILENFCFFVCLVWRIYRWLPSCSHRLKWPYFTVKGNDSKLLYNFGVLIQSFVKPYSELTPMFMCEVVFQWRPSSVMIWSTDAWVCVLVPPLLAVWRWPSHLTSLDQMIMYKYFCTWVIHSIYSSLICVFISQVLNTLTVNKILKREKL